MIIFWTIIFVFFVSSTFTVKTDQMSKLENFYNSTFLIVEVETHPILFTKFQNCSFYYSYSIEKYAWYFPKDQKVQPKWKLGRNLKITRNCDINFEDSVGLNKDLMDKISVTKLEQYGSEITVPEISFIPGQVVTYIKDPSWENCAKKATNTLDETCFVFIYYNIPHTHQLNCKFHAFGRNPNITLLKISSVNSKFTVKTREDCQLPPTSNPFLYEAESSQPKENSIRKSMDTTYTLPLIVISSASSVVLIFSVALCCLFKKRQSCCFHTAKTEDFDIKNENELYGQEYYYEDYNVRMQNQIQDQNQYYESSDFM